MMHVKVEASNPGLELMPIGLVQFFPKIAETYKKRSEVFYWKIFSVEARLGTVVIVVPNETNLDILADCLQECLPMHGVMVSL